MMWFTCQIGLLKDHLSQVKVLMCELGYFSFVDLWQLFFKFGSFLLMQKIF